MYMGRNISKKEVDFKIRLHPELIPVRGNAIFSGDEAYDEFVEDQILDKLVSGNQWAWCTVEVEASYNGNIVSEYLGACSYESERDFRACDTYAEMCDRAFEKLSAKVNTPSFTIIY